jgi:predicted transcriptional regulator
MFRLSKSEMEIMTLLWREKRPLSRSEIIELSTKENWKSSSIHIMLNSLLEKGAIEVAGFTKTGTHYGRTFQAAISDAQYAVMQIRDTESYRTSKIDTIKNVVTALLSDEDIGNDTIDELEELLEERKTVSSVV